MGSMQNLPTEQVWDRHAIKAAITRKGKNLSELAAEYNVSAQTVRNALDKPCKSGELIIAAFLSEPVHVLFPDRWTEDNKRIYPRVIKRKQGAR
ncbi:helix-turn-helix domain-containing protein [Acinetobacter junii]|uniref:helix-turn-helix domain-containing protein n=1 Tax=Acinetobacter junii TaxID=40215 RepID=UPI00100FB7EB|nr:helix-turn-helix domain-containing protein [Acinetobacter junii]RXS92943.1 GntR family transcriptional regulator [Acinetobacter junii]